MDMAQIMYDLTLHAADCWHFLRLVYCESATVYPKAVWGETVECYIVIWI